MGIQQICFGDWVFEPRTCSLRCGDRGAVLEPRVSDLLEFFLLNPDEVHSHQRLVDTVWGGQVVSDEAVRRAVSVLRRTADGALSRWIKTVYKRGYIASFPVIGNVVSREQVLENLLRNCDASLAYCVNMPSPGERRRREALACLRNALELDPRLLEVLGSRGTSRGVR